MPHVIEGVVKQDDHPVSDAKVYLLDTRDEVITEVLYTDPGGEFRTEFDIEREFHITVLYQDFDGNYFSHEFMPNVTTVEV